MTSRIAKAYDALVLNNPWIVLVLLLSLLAFFGYHTKDFKLDASADTLLLEDDADLKKFRQNRERYPGQELLLVTYTPNKDLFSDEALEPLKQLREDLKKVSIVDTVFTILDAPLFVSTDDDIEDLIRKSPSLEKPDVDRSRAREELLNSPVYKDLIVSSDGKTTAVLLTLVPNKSFGALLKSRNDLRDKQRLTGLSPEEAQELASVTENYEQESAAVNDKRHEAIVQIREIMEPYREHGTLYLGGLPMITDDTVTYVRNDLTVFGAGVLAFLIIVLTAIFRKPRWIALPLVSCFYAGLTMIGLLGFMGWKVTVISSNFLALMLIITISMNIHLIVRYLQLHRDQPDDDQYALVRTTVHKMVKPCLYTALTTIIGFGSLVVSGIKPVIDFGWMMSAGLTVTFITSFLLFPTLLLLIGKTGTNRTINRDRFMLPEYLARMTEFHGNKVLIFAVILCVVSGIGISQLRVENSFINYFSEETEIYQGLKLIDEDLGGTTPLEVIVKLESDVEELTAEDLAEMTAEEIAEERAYIEAQRTKPELWFTPEKVKMIKQAHDYLDSLPETGKVMSFATSVRVAESFAKKELDGFELALLYSQLPEAVRSALVDPYLSIPNNEMRLEVRILDSKPDLRRADLLEKIRDDLNKENGFKELSDYKYMVNDVEVSGLLVLYNNMLQSLFSSQIKSIGVVMLGIGIMFMILFRSVTLSVIGIVPNLLGAAAVLGVMGLSKIPLDMMTITVAAITIGIAVDNGIHYIYRFREEYAKNASYEETLHICHASIGKAVFYTTMTIIFGFSILMMSNFIPTIYFGVLTGAAMFIALLAALTVLPKLILWWKPFG
ncbi:MMPL family transporter [Terasakiella sp. A23]|uniref:efflux RND transporter permease subunit n=1 Tax=Terasakiella sp. FCG-A23 TaxID=3080561 RepID=UPI002955ABF6|nr:MMPL family transporter [Terasakiella sp. A23]MDV7340644.1 MMPL family transporter [Terasakiella sp. A23]